ncbi:MAG TPA: HAMP domain-containing sensor histidine kinase [Ramlibacter sp.]
MQPDPTPPGVRWKDYVLAVAWVAAALFLRFLLNPVLGQQGPYLILTLSIVFAALYGGFGPAMLATVLSTLVGTYLFVGSKPGWESVLEPANIARTLLFLAIGLSISVVGGRLRQSRQALSEAVRDLRRSNRAKDHVLATVAHEIRNPLSALQSAGQVLERSASDPARVAWAADVVRRQVAHMARMADDLMDMSKVLHGNMAMQMGPVDLRDVLASAVEQSAQLVAAKEHRITVDLPPEPAMVRGDASRLVQVFANLLINAARYTAPGGHIALKLAADGMEWRTTVTDSGEGLDPATIDDLFEPFVQAPSAAANPGAKVGLGLGLAIVKRIVELHGGRVVATSEGLGRGASFSVVLGRHP